jgi:hypothetical protein
MEQGEIVIINKFNELFANSRIIPELKIINQYKGRHFELKFIYEYEKEKKCINKYITYEAGIYFINNLTIEMFDCIFIFKHIFWQSLMNSISSSIKEIHHCFVSSDHIQDNFLVIKFFYGNEDNYEDNYDGSELIEYENINEIQDKAINQIKENINLCSKLDIELNSKFSYLNLPLPIKIKITKRTIHSTHLFFITDFLSTTSQKTDKIFICIWDINMINDFDKIIYHLTKVINLNLKLEEFLSKLKCDIKLNTKYDIDIFRKVGYYYKKNNNNYDFNIELITKCLDFGYSKEFALMDITAEQKEEILEGILENWITKLVYIEIKSEILNLMHA